ncbi:MAG: 4Fe-4S dicluster domain-containing protein [Candidatus Hydrothermales bacterium]
MRLNPYFKEEISRELKDHSILMCYQCGKCSSFCPVFNLSPEKFNPRKLIEMVYIGAEDVLKTEDIWRCTTCYECFENCPQKVNFVEIIFLLRTKATERGYAPKIPMQELVLVRKEGFSVQISPRAKKWREEVIKIGG